MARHEQANRSQSCNAPANRFMLQNHRLGHYNPRPMSENHVDPESSPQDEPRPNGDAADSGIGDSADTSKPSPERTSLIELVPLHMPAWLLAYLVVGLGGAGLWLISGDELADSFGTFVFGVVMLLLGGQVLVDGSISLARAAGVPTLLIGLTIVAIGTSAPELAFNVIAAFDKQTDLSLGNVVGSNIANIGLVLGLGALVRPLVVHSRIIAIELPILIIVTGATIALAFRGVVPWDGEDVLGYTWVDGAGMCVAFVLLLTFWFHLGKRDSRDPLSQELAEAMEDDPLRPLVAVLYVVGGFAFLGGGGHFAKTAAIDIATSAGLSPTMIGLTIVALATSLPEVVTSVIACKRGHTDLAVGNIIGSNLFNILLVLGVTSIITPVPIVDNKNIWDLGIMGAITLALLPLAITHQRKITRSEGVFLLLWWVAYIIFTVLRERW